MKDFIKGAIFGAVVTGVAVALTTPKTGMELREDIVDLSNDLYNRGVEKTHEITNDAKDLVNEKRNNLEQQINNLKQTMHQE